MARGSRGDVCFFKIESDENYYAYYSEQVCVAANGRDPEQIIREAAKKGEFPDGDRKQLKRGTDPDRFLDIHETRGGFTTFAFWLNAISNGVQRLRFLRDTPLLAHSLHSPSGEKFLRYPKVDYDDEGFWASFTCNKDSVRKSKLVERLDCASDVESRHHPLILTIPFTFNVVDPVLGVVPWIVPRDSRRRSDCPHSRTHGGVHPSPLSYVVLDVENGG